MNEPRARRRTEPEEYRLWLATAAVALVAVAAAWLIVLGAADTAEGSAAASPTSIAPATSTTTTAPVASTTSSTVAEVESVTAVDAAANSAVAETADFTGLRIEIVGDSLAASTANELRARFDGAQLGFDTEPGRSLRGGAAALRAAGAVSPDLAVVVLGTNDWNGPEDYPEQLDDAAERLAGAACVVWADAQEFRDGLVSVNEDIRDAAERHGWLVAPWSALAGPSELHTSDGYHLSAAGQELLADLIVATASGCTA